MQPPASTEIFEGKLATYWLDEGILVSRTKHAERSMANVVDAFDLIRKITGNKKVPLLHYIASAIPTPDKDAVKFIASESPSVFSAIAFVGEFGLGRIVREILFKEAEDTVPMEQFVDYNEAKKWLKQFL